MDASSTTDDLAERAVELIDLTNLDDDCTADDVAALCADAIDAGVAAVCVWPDFVEQANALVGDSGVAVATVVNFPTGDERPYAVGAVTEWVLLDGATEVDLVLPYRRFVAGDVDWCADLLDRVRSITDGRAHLKVILETGELGDVDTIRRAAEFAIAHGADFIKTSTGKSRVSATTDAVEVMASVIAAADRPVGLKPSGGIRTRADAAEYLAIVDRVLGPSWATPGTFRFGASGLLHALTG